jgi:hypothetical protein
MTEHENFFSQVRRLLEDQFLSLGYRLDDKLSGYTVTNAVHLNIDPAMEAIVRTEHRIAPRMKIDLRELIHVQPPIDQAAGGSNLFITFTAESAQFEGGNATAFGIHLTRVEPSDDVHEKLDDGIFVPGSMITDAFRMVVFLRTQGGEVSLAKTGVFIGLDQTGRLAAYQSFAFGPGLSVVRHPPSSLADADPQVMLYVFLTLTVFLMVNQGEAPMRWESDQKVIIG